MSCFFCSKQQRVLVTFFNEKNHERDLDAVPLIAWFLFYFQEQQSLTQLLVGVLAIGNLEPMIKESVAAEKKTTFLGILIYIKPLCMPAFFYLHNTLHEDNRLLIQATIQSTT